MLTKGQIDLLPYVIIYSLALKCICMFLGEFETTGLIHVITKFQT